MLNDLLSNEKLKVITSKENPMTQEELFERSMKVAPGGVHSPVRSFKSVGGNPIFFKRAEGAYLYDTDNKEYVDFCLSFFCVMF